MEEWKDIPGYENQYQISDTGIVRSLPRKTVDGRGSYILKGKIQRIQIGRSGYPKYLDNGHNC